MEPLVVLLVAAFALGCAVLEIVAMWKIFEKCGWSGPLSLLLLVPLVNLIILLVVAFSDPPGSRPDYQPPPRVAQ